MFDKDLLKKLDSATDETFQDLAYTIYKGVYLSDKCGSWCGRNLSKREEELVRLAMKKQTSLYVDLDLAIDKENMERINLLLDAVQFKDKYHDLVLSLPLKEIEEIQFAAIKELDNEPSN